MKNKIFQIALMSVIFSLVTLGSISSNKLFTNVNSNLTSTVQIIFINKDNRMPLTNVNLRVGNDKPYNSKDSAYIDIPANLVNLEWLEISKEKYINQKIKIQYSGMFKTITVSLSSVAKNPFKLKVSASSILDSAICILEKNERWWPTDDDYQTSVCKEAQPVIFQLFNRTSSKLVFGSGQEPDLPTVYLEDIHDDVLIDVVLDDAGNEDTDGDSIPDYLDKCPAISGSSKHNGCPSTRRK